MKLHLVPYLLALLLPIVATFVIDDCGHSTLATGYAISLAQQLMAAPLVDVQRGSSSSHGYTAMYKADEFKYYLHSFMSKVQALSATRVLRHSQEPTFVCVVQGMEHKYNLGYDPFERCLESKATSFWAKDTAFVFLCPSFSSMAFKPPLTPHGPVDIYCPVVLKNAFVGRSDPLVKYQAYDLVHQLAHLYLQAAGLTDETQPKERKDWNDCVGLGWSKKGPSLSARNPFNLVYYVAFVNQGCTQMPNPFLPPFKDRSGGLRLLSVGNMTGMASVNSTDLPTLS